MKFDKRGRWCRWNIRDYLDEQISLDVREMNRIGFLLTGRIFNMEWGSDDKIYGVTSKEKILILYMTKKRDDGDTIIEPPISLSYTNCNFGGKRVWFVCPFCKRLAAKLYLLYMCFICRSCCGLPYQSQSENFIYRAMRRVRKIRDKLQADIDLSESIYLKPKRMHRSTFERLRAKVESDVQFDFRFDN